MGRLRDNERRVIYGHGVPFVVKKTRFGYNISQNQKWVWRAKTYDEARRVVMNHGIRLLRKGY